MNFEYVKNLGQGGFGIVDEVQNDNGNKFARKTFQINQNPSFPKDLELSVRKRFIREANIQSQINHKNIVPIIEKHLDDNPPFFIMPKASGSLQDFIEKDRTLNGEFMGALMDIMAGLEELHSLGIYHRDLKPANVLRFSDGERKWYSIGDFGLMSINQTMISTITQTGMRMGSDYYTAPEIVKDLKNASEQSDIYSLGCIIHDFIGNESRIVCHEIREDCELSGILLGCTRLDPTRRFKSVSDVRDAILSIGDIKITAKTEIEERIIGYLENELEIIGEVKWNEIINFIENSINLNEADLVLYKISSEHIDQINLTYSFLGAKLGLIYANWIRGRSFDFAKCDGLSIRLAKFIYYCPIAVKAECLIAMLKLGTSHNRWYVESKFVGLIGANLEENLARRLAIEFRVDSYDTCRRIRHLVHSITYKINQMHPILLKTVNEICNDN